MISGSVDFFGERFSQTVSKEKVEVIQRILLARMLAHPTFEISDIARHLNILTAEIRDENILGDCFFHNKVP